MECSNRRCCYVDGCDQVVESPTDASNRVVRYSNGLRLRIELIELTPKAVLKQGTEQAKGVL